VLLQVVMGGDFYTPYTFTHTPYTFTCTPYTFTRTPYTITRTPYTITRTPYTFTAMVTAPKIKKALVLRMLLGIKKTETPIFQGILVVLPIGNIFLTNPVKCVILIKTKGGRYKNEQ